MKDLELRLTDLLARKADEVDVRPVDGFAETPYATALASTDLDSVTETRDLATIDLEPTNAKPAPSRNRRRVALGMLAGAAVVVAIALVATRDSDDVTPVEQPSPNVTVPPTTRPRALFGTEGERFVPGTYFVDEVDGTPTARIFVTIGAGWQYLKTTNSDSRVLGKPGNGCCDGSGYVAFSRPVRVFSDACNWSDGFYPGPVATLDGLVAALTEQGGWADVTAPSDISIDGYAGKAFQRTVPAVISDCDTMVGYSPRLRTHGRHAFRSWEIDDEMSGGEFYEPGEIETLWVLDIDGTVVVINTRPFPEASAAARAEFAAVLDSIRIDRA